MYTLRAFPYCGLSMPAETFSESLDARQAAADLIRRRRRQGFPVLTLARGASWEVCEPEGAAMVPDACGTIELSRVTFDCPECGTAYDDAEGRAECCAPETDTDAFYERSEWRADPLQQFEPEAPEDMAYDAELAADRAALACDNAAELGAEDMTHDGDAEAAADSRGLYGRERAAYIDAWRDARREGACDSAASLSLEGNPRDE